MGKKPDLIFLKSRHTDGQSIIKMCFTSLILRERQTKTVMRYHSHILESVLSKRQKITNDEKDMGKGEHL